MNITNLNDVAATLGNQASVGIEKVSAVSQVTPAKVVKEQAEPSRQELEQAVKRANELIKVNSADLEFQMDPDLKRPIVKVIDRETQTVLRQIPSVEMLEVARAMEKMQGVLVSEKA